MNTVSAHQSPDLAWLLEGLARDVPAIRGSVLLSADGLTKAAHGLDRSGSEYLAALASGLYSMSRGAAGKFDGSNEVRQVVAEFRSSQLYITWAGSNSVLAVLANEEADPAVVGLEMARLIKAVRPFLGTPTRTPATPNGAAGSGT
jgi:predicted regulator of Ras-like GTPase activity (Roadblock/LC7/MglB family)